MGTAGDRHNIAFAFSHLKMEPSPHAVVGGDEGLPGKPEPAILLEAARDELMNNDFLETLDA